MELVWKAALQGIIQGITEFLPVSSSAHLLLFGDLVDFGHGDFVKLFNILIQFASILAVAIYFFRTLFPAAAFRLMAVPVSERRSEIMKDPALRNWFDLCRKIALGFLPMVFIGFVVVKAGWKDYLDEQPWVRVGALLIGGILLLRIERWCRHEHPAQTVAELSWRTVLLIGLAQCLAIIPGMSRSASTIVAALALGVARPLAAEFSFLVAIPTMFAASAYSLLKFHGSLSRHEWIALAVGFAVTFLVSLSVVSWLMNYLRTHTFELFGWYRIALAVAVACWLWFC